jgi:CBS-domain-containing membrane protein
MSSLVKDVMTTRVIWVRRDTPFVVLAAALGEYHVSAFPVVNDESEVIGVVSESDMLAKEVFGLDDEDDLTAKVEGILHRRQREKARGATAGELMSAPAVTASPDDTVEHAAQLMYHRGVKRLPVVTESGLLAGIVSRGDLLSVYGRSDAEIRAEAESEVALAEGDPAAVQVWVWNGVVTLSGETESEAVARRIARQVRHLRGVVAVRDRLRYTPAKPEHFDVLTAFPSD